ncbi:hypothetical protein BJX70DRAFT_314242 [Aspergillus crustosus]
MCLFILTFLLALVLATYAHPTPDETTSVDINTEAEADLFYNDKTTFNATTAEISLEARARKLQVYCTGESEGNVKDLKKAIKYLREERWKQRKPTMHQGSCGTAVCAGRTKVRWCNDSGYEKSFADWNPIADGAQVILDHCKKGKKWKQGHERHIDSWRVIVEDGECYMQPGP